MNANNSVKKVFLIALFALVGFSAQAIAERGMGYGPYPRWGHQPMHAWHHGGDEGPGFGYCGDLSKEDIQKLEKERADFFEGTKDLRAKIYQKRLELKSELAKENPDAKKAAELQTEISGLKAEFDQKRLNHFLNMRKISPDMGRGFGGGYGMMGPGMMHGGGYGMGPGMMGGGYGMGPGMMGPGYYQQNEACQKFLDDTAGTRKELNMKRYEYFEAIRNPKTTPETVAKLEKELRDIQEKVYSKAPQGCWAQ